MRESIRYLHTQFYESLLLQLRAISIGYMDQGDFVEIVRITESRNAVQNTILEISEIIQGLNPMVVPSFIEKLKKEIPDIIHSKFLAPEFVNSVSGHVQPYIDFINVLSVDNYAKLVELNSPKNSRLVGNAFMWSRPRQHLAMHYIFAKLDAECNYTKRAKFISGLTGENWDTMNRKLSGVLYDDKGKFRKMDHTFLLQEFSKLEMDSIVELITKEMKNTKY